VGLFLTTSESLQLYYLAKINLQRQISPSRQARTSKNALYTFSLLSRATVIIQISSRCTRTILPRNEYTILKPAVSVLPLGVKRHTSGKQSGSAEGGVSQEVVHG
jgi:hypothetical protein